jgi:hypothetical protein
MAMPPTPPPGGAIFVMGLIVLVAVCFILMMVYKLAVYLAVRRAAAMSSGDVWDDDTTDEITDESPATTSRQNNNNAIAITQPDRNALLLQAKAEALAALVKAEKVGETEGIKLVFGVNPSSSNPRYIAARAALKEELFKLDPPKFNLTPEQIQARQALGLEHTA